MRVDVRAFLREWDCSPFKNPVWYGMDAPITRQEVGQALATEDLEHSPYDPEAEEYRPRAWHARRIAYLVTNGWDQPIELDLGAPSLGCTVLTPILDGHHRFAAALYLGHNTIEAEVSGELNWIRQFEASPPGKKTPPEV